MRPFHPWHDVPPGPALPSRVTAVIEIPKGTRAKYELDAETGLLKLDRVLYSSVYYPANYGFIPRTLGDDGDALDVLVLSQIEMQPLCMVEAKIIGVMRVVDRGDVDDKLLSVCANDMSVNHVNDLADLSPHFIEELRHFFEEYKRLEQKEVKIEAFSGAEVAKGLVTEAVEKYRVEYAAS